MKRLVVLVFALAAAAPGEEPRGQVLVTAQGFKNQEGRAIVALYQRGENWLDIERAYEKRVVPIGSDSVTVTFEKLPYDTYAVSVVHDRNENQKLDMRWFPWPKPKEGAGVSNNRIRKTGPPEVDKAMFELDRPSISIRIEMVY